MSNYQVKRVLEIKAELGESPAWSVEDQALYWIDIHKKTINRFDPASGVNKVWNLPAMPGCFALRDGNGAVIAARDGIYDFDFGTADLKKLTSTPYDSAIFRFNDGRTDRQGRLWVGTISADFTKLSENKAAMYRFDGVNIESCIAPITLANGTAFSPDGKTMYRAETAYRKIFAYDYDPETGTPSHERIFAVTPPEVGRPDGATVDTEGCYWAALPGSPQNGGIGRFTPDGKLDLYIEVPLVGPTMVAFGGPKMSTLYVTTCRLEHLRNNPHSEMSGDILAIETSFQGIPETKFKPRS